MTTANEQLREAVTSGILAARRNGTVRITPAGVPALADEILRAVSEMGHAPAVTAVVTAVVPAATPVSVVDPAELIAAVASHAARNAPADEAVTTAEVPCDPDNVDTRFLMWEVQHLFGCHVLANDALGVWRMGGRPSDLAALRSMFGALRDAGTPEAAALPEADRPAFWRTLGNAIVSTDRGAAQKEAAAARKEAARDAAVARWAPKTVAKPDVAAEGSQVHRRVVRALANAAA